MVKTVQPQNAISENTRQSAKKPYVMSQSTALSLKLKKLDASEKYQPPSGQAAWPRSPQECLYLNAQDLSEICLSKPGMADPTKPTQAKLNISPHHFLYQDNQNKIVVLRTPVLLRRIALSKATLYNLINPKSKYFDPVLARCKVQLTKKSVGFIESEVNAWLASRMKVGI